MVKAGAPTRYEVALILPGGAQFLVGYTPRRSRPGLLAAVQRVGPSILARMPDLPPEARMTYAGGALHLGNGAEVRFTGRTQRDAQGSALPFVADCATVAG